MGILYLVSTPIGNLEDITLRAVKIVQQVSIIACEDTRRTGLLLQHLGVSNKPRLISYYDEIEEKRTSELIELLKSGEDVALISDAGTPTISDPGFRLVRECIKQGIPMTSIPGPSSPITALSLSGLPTDNFWFLGYLPPKQGRRTNFLNNLKKTLAISEKNPTVIYFEAPHRLQESLEDLKSVFGDIDVVLTRELTKVHEEVWRGKVSSALTHFPTPRGEYVVLFHLKRSDLTRSDLFLVG